MKLLLEIFLILELSTKYFHCFWPAPMNVHFKDHETFVISSDDENEDDNENEMIQPEDVADIKLLAEDEQKYQPLHSHVKRYNMQITKTATVHSDIPYRLFPEDRSMYDDEPVITGLKDNLVTNLQATTNRHRRNDILQPADFNTMYSEVVEEEQTMEPYDYQKFKDEYYQDSGNITSTNQTLNNTETGKPEGAVKDAVKKIIDLKKPRNCTKVEASQYGFKAFQCLYYDYKNAKNSTEKHQVFTKSWRIIRVWLFIYVCIAVPLWCQKGWCCCCFRCKFCFPWKRIRENKKFFVQNPPGVLIQIDKNKPPTIKNYTPTYFEEEAYINFEASIKNL